MAGKMKRTPVEERLYIAMVSAERLAQELKENCPHRLVQDFKSAVCAICEGGFGWWCPDSPDNVCHYYPDFGVAENEPKIKLLDGTIIAVPEDKADDNYSDDWCIFCEHPEERK